MKSSTEFVVGIVAIVAMIVLATHVIFEFLCWSSRFFEHRFSWLPKLIDRSRKSARFFIGIVIARLISLRIAHVREAWAAPLDRVLQVGVIVGIVWLAVSGIRTIEDQILKNEHKKDRDPVDRRRFETQVTLLRRLADATFFAIGVVAVLMTFPTMRTLGGSLLAPAGLISIIAGLAAQSTLTNVFAGIQLAVSDSVRLGDVIAVEGQSGTVSQLTLTNVELRLWDGRTLILPSAYFTSKPFENWTRRLNQIGGSIFVDIDWATSIDPIRDEVTRMLHESELWDGRRNFVVVADLTGTTRRLQIGISAANTGDLFALQSLVREKLTDFLVEQHPGSLVRARVEHLGSASEDHPAIDPKSAESATLSPSQSVGY